MSEAINGEVIESGQIARRADAPAYSPIVPRVGVAIRPGTITDLPFIDRMQKANGRALGFLPTKALEGKIKLGHVLVAERSEQSGPPHPNPSTSRCAGSREGEGVRVGYLIAADRYQKRDEIGY